MSDWFTTRMFAEPLFYKDFGLIGGLDIRNSKYMQEPGNQVKNIHNDDYFAGLKKRLIDWSYEIFDKAYGYDMTDLKVEMTSMWLNKTPKGVFHPPHHHANNILSGVFFPEGDGEDFVHLNFMRPVTMQLYPESKIKNETEFNQYQYYMKCKQGYACMFPSYINHYVDTNHNNRERLSIAFDILIRGVYSDTKDGVTKHTI